MTHKARKPTLLRLMSASVSKEEAAVYLPPTMHLSNPDIRFSQRQQKVGQELESVQHVP